jgi:hypothetical protein
MKTIIVLSLLAFSCSKGGGSNSGLALVGLLGGNTQSTSSSSTSTGVNVMGGNTNTIVTQTPSSVSSGAFSFSYKLNSIKISGLEGSSMITGSKSPITNSQIVECTISPTIPGITVSSDCTIQVSLDLNLLQSDPTILKYFVSAPANTFLGPDAIIQEPMTVEGKSVSGATFSAKPFLKMMLRDGEISAPAYVEFSERVAQRITHVNLVGNGKSIYVHLQYKNWKTYVLDDGSQVFSAAPFTSTDSKYFQAEVFGFAFLNGIIFSDFGILGGVENIYDPNQGDREGILSNSVFRPSSVNYSTACNYLNQQNKLGYNTWRMPTLEDTSLMTSRFSINDYFSNAGILTSTTRNGNAVVWGTDGNGVYGEREIPMTGYDLQRVVSGGVTFDISKNPFIACIVEE